MSTSSRQNDGNPKIDDWVAFVTSSFASALVDERAAINEHLNECHHRLLSELDEHLRSHGAVQETLPRSNSLQDTLPEGKLSQIAEADLATTDLDSNVESTVQRILTKSRTSLQEVVYGHIDSTTDQDWRRRMSSPSSQSLESTPKKKHHDADVFHRLVVHPCFDGVFLFLIMVHTCQMMLSSQYKGIESGYVLNYPGIGVGAADAWPGAKDVLDMIDFVFAIAYTFELGLKLIGLRLQFLQSAWNMFDFVLVALWYIDEFGSFDFLNTMILRLGRLGKLMRVVRHLDLLKKYEQFDCLHMLITAICSSLPVLVWSTMLLSAFLILASLLTNGLLSSYLEDGHIPEQERREVYKYFGTFTRAFVTMFEISFAGHAPVVRLVVERVDEWWALYFLVFKLVVSLSIMKVITGIFLHQTFQVCSEDDELMTIQKKRAMRIQTKKMDALFKRANTEGGCTLSHCEFIHVMEDDWVQLWMNSMEIDVSNLQRLWQVLDTSGDGQLSAHELVSGMRRVKGAAKSLDMQCNLLRSEGMTHRFQGLRNTVDEVLTAIKQVQSMQAPLGAKVLEPADKANNGKASLADRPHCVNLRL